MQSIIIDAGPLIALFNPKDKYHPTVINYLKQHKPALLTTWPVITEVMHMLNFNVNIQLNFLEWLDRGALAMFDLSKNHLNRIAALVRKYHDVPMDLADASLVIIAEELRIRKIMTIDSDYLIYRTMYKEHFENVLNG